MAKICKIIAISFSRLRHTKLNDACKHRSNLTQIHPVSKEKNTSEFVDLAILSVRQNKFNLQLKTVCVFCLQVSSQWKALTHPLCLNPRLTKSTLTARQIKSPFVLPPLSTSPTRFQTFLLPEQLLLLHSRC